jgi:hypothetical protein
MSQVVCCPCGNPLDCDDLDLVVTLTCPVCTREITIEIEDGSGRTRRALLTVMEGPYWVGEQFVLPVGAELRIGKSPGNWLSLESDELSDFHCRLLLSDKGSVILEDHQSKSGTWVGKQRIARGRLAPMQSFRLGEFRFRFDLFSSEGTTIAAAPSPAYADASGPLPMMSRVQGEKSPLQWLTSRRYIVARRFVQGFAILTGLYHLFNLHADSQSDRPWLMAAVIAATLVAGILVTGRKMALVHRQMKFASTLLLIILATVDLSIGMPIGAIAALFLAACLVLLILRVPSRGLALFGTMVGLMSVSTMAMGTLRSVQSLPMAG